MELLSGIVSSWEQDKHSNTALWLPLLFVFRQDTQWKGGGETIFCDTVLCELIRSMYYTMYTWSQGHWREILSSGRAGRRGDSRKLLPSSECSVELYVPLNRHQIDSTGSSTAAIHDDWGLKDSIPNLPPCRPSPWKTLLEETLPENTSITRSGSRHLWLINYHSIPHGKLDSISTNVTGPSDRCYCGEIQITSHTVNPCPSKEACRHVLHREGEAASVAYLGFQKRGGGKFSLATSAHTKGGAKPSFPIFLVCKKKFFFAKGGAWPNGPPKYASGLHDVEWQAKILNTTTTNSVNVKCKLVLSNTTITEVSCNAEFMLFPLCRQMAPMKAHAATINHVTVTA